MIASWYQKRSGRIFINTFTKNNTAGQLLSETIKTYKEFYEKGVTEEEVQAGKSYLIGVFPQSSETQKDLLQFAGLRVFDVPDSYLYDFFKKIFKSNSGKSKCCY